MKHGLKFAILAILPFTISACGQRETLRTVNDFCLLDKVIKVAVAPAQTTPDPDNQYDTDQTVLDVLEHNVVHERVCPTRPSS